MPLTMQNLQLFVLPGTKVVSDLPLSGAHLFLVVVLVALGLGLLVGGGCEAVSDSGRGALLVEQLGGDDVTEGDVDAGLLEHRKLGRVTRRRRRSSNLRLIMTWRNSESMALLMCRIVVVNAATIRVSLWNSGKLASCWFQ